VKESKSLVVHLPSITPFDMYIVALPLAYKYREVSWSLTSQAIKELVTQKALASDTNSCRSKHCVKQIKYLEILHMYLVHSRSDRELWLAVF
jgi:hypothetical protein